MKSPPDPFRPSPLLPLEVIERVISHSCDHDRPYTSPKSILNFSLTCSDLRPRSLCFLVADAALYSREKVFDFCGFLQTKPRLKPFVRSISIHPDDFAPVPLLQIDTLPNLSRIDFVDYEDDTHRLNQSTLTCSQLLSTHIQTLSLFGISFKTCFQFFGMLLAFPKIMNLICREVEISGEEDTRSLEVVKRRLSQRLHLLTLTIGSSKKRFNRVCMSAGTKLLESGLFQDTIENLTFKLDGVYKSTRFQQQFDWPRLRSLTLKLWSSDVEEITSSIAFLQDFHHCRTLKEVTIEIHERAIVPTAENLTHCAELCSELEHTLLRFSQARLVWIMAGPPIAENSFWIERLGKRFPMLFQRGTLVVVPDKDFPSGGHTDMINALVISPDCKWAASGSMDGTIILWEIASGVIVKQWVPHVHPGELKSLAFSPNGRYLLSTPWRSSFYAPIIWDLCGDLHQVLEGHFNCEDDDWCCVWSPKGDVIASRSNIFTVCLLDTHTFRPLHALKHTNPEIALVEFSPDGRWLLTGCHPSSYYLWNVASGTGRQVHMSVIKDPHHPFRIAVSFNPNSTRFAIVSSRGMIEILPIDEEEPGCVILGCGVGKLGWETQNIAFSPDGNLVLTVPSRNAPTRTMKIWDAYTGTELLSLEGHHKWISTACFSPCGKYIASGSDDHTVRLWRTSDGSCITILSEHRDEVTRVVFSPDGKTLISGSENGMVIIRQMHNVLPIDERDP